MPNDQLPKICYLLGALVEEGEKAAIKDILKIYNKEGTKK